MELLNNKELYKITGILGHIFPTGDILYVFKYALPVIYSEEVPL